LIVGLLASVPAFGQLSTFGPITVPSTAVIFDPDNVLSPDQLAALATTPPYSPLPAVNVPNSLFVGQTVTFSASGLIDTPGCCGPVYPTTNPDGYQGNGANITSLGSISGFISPNRFPLLGVFTNGAPSGPPPAAYSYSAESLAQASFSPLLNQIFVIGDGLTGTGSGSTQVFNVPVTATELWLGYADATQFQGAPGRYGDNIGSVSVSVAVNTTPLEFVPITPCRLADTRNTNGAFGPLFGAPSLVGNSARTFVPSHGSCNIPSNAAAFSLNVTAVTHSDPSRGHGYLGYLTIWPTGYPRSQVSTLNSWDGRTKANAAIVPAGGGGGVDVFVTDDADLVLDINGYFVPPSSKGLKFFPVKPCRVFDTRNATGPLGGPTIGAEESRDFPVLQSRCEIPSNAQAYSLNMTAIPREEALQYLTVWPTGVTQPYVSTLNATTGTTTANAAIVPAGADGSISVYVSDESDVFADINGYFAPAASGGLALYNLRPCRVFNNADPTIPPPSGMIPTPFDSSCGVPSTAQAVVLNATTQSPRSLGFLTLWAAGAPQPYASTLNAFDAATTSNMAIVPATGGMVSAYTSDPGWLILDASGYFAP
jgi:hypothetical protein